MAVHRGRKKRLKNNAAAPAARNPPRSDASHHSDSSDVEIISVTAFHNTGSGCKRPRPRRAAIKNLEEKEDEEEAIEAENVIEVKPEPRLADSEATAIMRTREGGEGKKEKPQRRLLDFVVHDGQGAEQPIEILETVPLFVTATILPVTGLLEKQRGFRCQSFGPLESWCISGYEDGVLVVWICTEAGDYICCKPAASYKTWYSALADKSSLCIAVFKALSKPDGGDPELPLESLVAQVARRSKKTSLSQPFSREYLISIGGFVSSQLKAMDVSASDGDQVFTGLPALVALEKESASCRMEDVSLACHGRKNGTLTINEPDGSNPSSEHSSGLTDQYAGDAQYAQLLQEREERAMRMRSGGAKAKSYIKINEDELAVDYPFPEFYKPEEEETDEYLVMSGDDGELEHRMLYDWALYNSDMRFVSLELLPMVSGAETDVEVFGSGLVTEDNFEYCMDNEPDDAASTTHNENLLRVYLSSIKEWKIEFGAKILSISIRTAGAWYRLGPPSAQYAAWYSPVLKTARLARHIITMLKVVSRVSRLSFPDVVKRLTDQTQDSDTFVGSKVADVERFVVVHGQILLQQFSEFPDDTIRKSSFVTGLLKMMEERHHTKLKVSKKKLLRGRNLNPRGSLQPDASKTKPMRATTTQLVNRIWSDYCSTYNEDGTCEPEAENVRRQQDQKADAKAIRGHLIKPGEAVRYEVEGAEDAFLLVEYLYKANGRSMVHGRVLVKGESTVLGDAASKRELFLTGSCDNVEVRDAKEIVTVELRRRPWGHMHRKDNATADEEERERGRDREIKGLPTEYFCQAIYVPEKGGFFRIPHDKLALGTGVCEGCKSREEAKTKDSLSLFANLQGFRFQGVEYHINDFVYVDITQIMTQSQDEIQKFKGGRNKGLRAFTICQLMDIIPSSKTGAEQLTVRKFYRPEDVDLGKAYKADVHEVYFCERTTTISLAAVRGKCTVVKRQEFTVASETKALMDLFFCSCVYDPLKGTVKQLPANVKLGKPPAASSLASAKGKGKLVEDDRQPKETSANDEKLSMLDIFAGCGGLSEGIHQSGIASTKWAIEYDHAAAEAFKMNHPTATVFFDNCNVVLRSIMEIGGDLDDCCSTPEAAEMASKLSENQKSSLPRPGEVDFISGGPPCQGFSGMNRFNKRNWSKIQCEMVLGFLSYADYFRPRYFLLENVRNFVSFNKGQTFRLTLASLLEMGYQVRFGILQAGHYGISQSRTRAIIWAAAPDEVLPDWPEPVHVFASAQLKIPLSGNSVYAAADDTRGGAPLRSITVRDTIGDLPPVANGTEKPETPYGNEPQSWFQKNIRGGATVLRDHICKEMNELNFIRCQRIPKRPGADWRDLPDEKVKLSTGQTVDLIPWCLPNTAERHNQWKGLFGRLDWDGNFPTSITDPQPMGKVGMCFHPEQDRIVTVRECARSQGFPDSYKFFGTMQNKHRQIGNAVPPPLAKALGVKLKEAIQQASS
ncbi:DNA (cytosine-5)-methyltransferase 1B [Selaginella moellendorffii]|uniref:DNA (cytosine-5)-methyltransferase 1B n=1 Tax=Selaginella moellendorffii TaxID=88036 RepID=UPI000D1CC050|nr:DNA (cytosine-5)-methyltransferase 1B [Selaginella moellendorffii]|eukprot:XP_024535317.1 DNA (cytosine-5)-methyltransferase 1B [Selaginella moellendorffii]